MDHSTRDLPCMTLPFFEIDPSTQQSFMSEHRLGQATTDPCSSLLSPYSSLSCQSTLGDTQNTLAENATMLGCFETKEVDPLPLLPLLPCGPSGAIPDLVPASPTEETPPDLDVDSDEVPDDPSTQPIQLRTSVKRQALFFDSRDDWYSLCFQYQGTIDQSRETLMSAIEETVLVIFRSIRRGEPIELPSFTRALPMRSRKRQRCQNDTDTQSDNLSKQPLSLATSTSALSFGEIFKGRHNKDLSNTEMLARYLRILEIIYEAVAMNLILTKRDIFYRDVALFGKQSVVNRMIDDISFHYNVPRSSLNITAASKGLICGPARIIMKNNKVIDCMSYMQDDEETHGDERGALIPPIDQVREVECRAKLMIVIEKEASFHNLISAGFIQSLPQHSILITGCGYPVTFPLKMVVPRQIAKKNGIQDISTRHMIKYLSMRNPSMPICALMDNDPYGLDIYAVYKWGSKAQAFDARNLVIPDILFIGITCQDKALILMGFIVRFGLPDEVYVPLTKKDREKGFQMLSNEIPGSTVSSSQYDDTPYPTSQRDSPAYRAFM
ncbi:Spo11/DNA topoisomerase VI subunit A [Radiomyces spectabilis]|uniref:Spo11/DNA topoisomerase VI subunit A n=1 Tax=Radiomyces spectabilis TaxID=64574 RepID=UPI0022202588|nr:Spo11/DNA topoisomerase VI subunit A [Radiomyces spectabilis]KAI8391460.1 Spo11/DNA topoisomerase VI subunit A [Radiomyces spectabilis]